MTAEQGGTPYGQLELGLGPVKEIPEGQLKVWSSVLDKLRMIHPEYSRYSINGLASIAPRYLTDPADILNFVAEYN